MESLDPGHHYLLNNQQGKGRQELFFFKDPEIHDTGHEGIICQELLRVQINRVEVLEAEKTSPYNAEILRHLREALFFFEMRALHNKIVEKGLKIESIATGPDGHLAWSYL